MTTLERDTQETLARIVKRAIDSVGPCDCRACLERIIAEDVKTNWPRIEAEQEREVRAHFIPVQDGVRETI